MKWRNVADLHQCLIDNLSTLRDTGAGAVVGVPRSGLMAASLAASMLNLPLSDPLSFVQGRVWWRNRPETIATQAILLIDDAVNTAGSLNRWAEIIRREYSGAIFRVGVFGLTDSISRGTCDIVLDEMAGRAEDRLFEWNVWKHIRLGSTVVDLDGVLCRDPTPEENDDGPRYAQFIDTAPARFVPMRPVLGICTARLEKYRRPTERWLAQHGIRTKFLWMLNLPDQKTRIESRAHVPFKIKTYSQNGNLFIESDIGQAHRIAGATSKPVICTDTMTLV